MQKEFLSYETVRDNSLKLARKIHQDGFVPDVIYVSLRGGAYIGNVISEYFKVVRRAGRPVFYAAVVARSYSDVNAQERIKVDGWTYSPEYLRHGDRILLVDDIFDSGKTANHLVQIFIEKGIPRSDIRVAVHDFKVRSYQDDPLPIQPDYYCRKIAIEAPQSDIWVHYLSHEIVGLTDQEIERHYSTDLEVKSIIRSIRHDK